MEVLVFTYSICFVLNFKKISLISNKLIIKTTIHKSSVGRPIKRWLDDVKESVSREWYQIAQEKKLAVVAYVDCEGLLIEEESKNRTRLGAENFNGFFITIWNLKYVDQYDQAYLKRRKHFIILPNIKATLSIPWKYYAYFVSKKIYVMWMFENDILKNISCWSHNETMLNNPENCDSTVQ